MNFFKLAWRLAARPLPGWPGRITLAGLLALLLPACAAVGVGLSALGSPGVAWALALAMGIGAFLAIPALTDLLRARAAALRKFRSEAAQAAAEAWESAVRSLLPRLASRQGAAAATQRRTLPPPPAPIRGRYLPHLALTARLLAQRPQAARHARSALHNRYLIISR